MKECPNGTFQTSFHTCEKCFETCEKCTGSTDSDCSSCNYGFLLSDGKCITKCPDNTTNINSKCINDTCYGNCALCGQNKSICITCKNDTFYDNVTKTCLNNSKCAGSSFFQNNECKKCNLECLTCEGNASNCTSCVDYYNKNSLFIQNGTGMCLNKCPSNYFGNKMTYIQTFSPYLNITYYKCEKCDENCLDCKDSGKNSCISCNQSNQLTQYLEYGNCISKCSQGLMLINSSICKENCSAEAHCYKCSNQNFSQCTECISPYEYLLNFKCYDQSQICINTHKFISQTNPFTCSECDKLCKTCAITASNCLSCFSEGNSSSSFPYLYINQCVYRCPAGYSPDYADNKICKDFICQKPCSKCSYNQSFCYECSSESPFLYNNNCFKSCPGETSYNQVLKMCVAQKSLSDIWASWAVFAIFIVILLYFSLSLFLSKITLSISSSLICLLQIVEFFSKIFIFGFLFNYRELAPCIFSFLNIINNCVISMIFQTLYIGVFEVHLKAFSLFKSKNEKFYKFVFFGMLIFGINFTYAFSSGLFKFVRSEFENNFSYSKGLNRMVFFSFLLAIMQLGVDCFILSKYTYEYDIFHLAYINMLMNSVIYLVWGWKKAINLMQKNKKLNKNS